MTLRHSILYHSAIGVSCVSRRYRGHLYAFSRLAPGRNPCQCPYATDMHYSDMYNYQIPLHSKTAQTRFLVYLSNHSVWHSPSNVPKVFEGPAAEYSQRQVQT